MAHGLAEKAKEREPRASRERSELSLERLRERFASVFINEARDRVRGGHVLRKPDQCQTRVKRNSAQRSGRVSLR